MAAPSNKSVKVLADLVTKKQIIKKDKENVLFSVSGTLLDGGHVSSSLPLTASSAYTPQLVISSSATFQVTELENLVTDKTTGKYNVDAAIHEIDKAIKKTGVTDAVRAAEAVNAYRRLRFQKTGSFDINGYAEVKLPANYPAYDYPTLVGGPVNGLYEPPVFDGESANPIDGALGEGNDPNFESFPTSSKNYIMLDVMVKDCESDPEDPQATWTNDILAVNLVVSGAADDELWVRMWAPELAGSETLKYRLLAVNEDPALYIIR